jgi:hypothetical protein
MTRPSAFTEPSSALALDPPAAESVLPSAPEQQPRSFEPPRDPGPPLEAVVATPADQRDPAEPFAVATSTLTGSAWSSAHSTAVAPVATGAVWAADQPWQSQYPPPDATTAAFPAPGTPQWFGPSAYQAPPPAPVVITPSTVLEASYYPLVITLVVGAVVGLLAPSVASFTLLLGIIFLSSGQTVAYRRIMLRNIAIGIAGVLVFLFLIFQFFNVIFAGPNLEVDPFVVAANWILLASTIGIQYAAMRSGERPERRPS